MTGKTLLDFLMSLIATISMEADSLKGLLWYFYYRMRFTSFRSRK